MPSETIKSLRSRIRSIESTQKIARAMFLSSSAKYVRAHKKMQDSRSFRIQAEAMLEILIPHFPYHSEADKACRIVIAGDRGMSGGYNNAILNSLSFTDDACYLPIGRKAFEKISRENAEILIPEPVSSEKATYAGFKPCGEHIASMIFDNTIGSLEIIHASFGGGIRTETIFPRISGNQAFRTAVFEPQPDEIIKNCLGDLIAGIIYACVCEAGACEQLSRKIAMETARKNADEMMERLKIRLNRMRQAAITQEIIEAAASYETPNGGNGYGQ